MVTVLTKDNDMEYQGLGICLVADRCLNPCGLLMCRGTIIQLICTTQTKARASARTRRT
jgi:hypothetical protein